MPKFSKSALIRLVNDSAAERIASHEKAIQELEQRPAHEDAMAEWRNNAIESVRELYKQIESRSDLSDEYLYTFRIPRPPEDNSRYIQGNRQSIEQVKRTTEHIIKLINALVTDKEGNVTLAVGDLRNLGLGQY